MYRGVAAIDVSSEGLLLCHQQWSLFAPTPWRLTVLCWQRQTGERRLQERVGHCALVHREMQWKHRPRERGEKNGGGRVTASLASQSPRREEWKLCAADCLTETQAAGWWHFMVTTCNPTLAGENPVFQTFNSTESLLLLLLLQPYKGWHTFAFVLILHRNWSWAMYSIEELHTLFISQSTRSHLFVKKQNLFHNA